MTNNFYLKNRTKLLLMVQELHKSGYGLLRVEPSVSPSGASWRCSFVDKPTKTSETASMWLCKYENSSRSGEIELTPKELADRFVADKPQFVALCVGKDDRYTAWYSQMLTQLDEGELPYAYGDYFSPGEYWKTSKEKEIKTLPGDEKYYVNY